MIKHLILIAALWQSLFSAALFAQDETQISRTRWLPLGLPAHVEAEARKANVSYEKIQSFLRKNFRKLIDNLGEIEIASEEFGLDQFLVAKMVFGLQRKVEKNPWPTGEHDQFLLKDELTIGYRLGAGFVVYGDIGYIKKYTLVQPMPSHREAMLSGDFIINLMLPYQIKDQRLPQKYVLMTEGSIEGRGRLKLGSGIVINPFVHQTHHSRVTLSRTFIDNRRPDLMRVFVDESAYREWGQLFYATYWLLSYNIFKATHRYGNTQRSFYEVQKNLPEYQEILYRLSVHNDYSILDDFALERRVQDQFRETTSEFSLFGIYHSTSRNRFDIIDELLTDSNGEMVLISQQYQHENERERSWFTFISGEEYFSNILFMAYNEEGELSRPHVVISTRQNDKRTRLKEFRDKYIAGINQIALQQNPIEISPELAELIDKNKPRVTLDIQITLDDKAILFLDTISEEMFWDKIEEITGKSKRTWKNALDFGHVRSNTMRNRDELRPLARRLNAISKSLKKLNKCDDNECRIKEITRIIRDGVHVSDGRFAPELLTILHTLVPGHMGIKAQISMLMDNNVIENINWSNGVEIDVPQQYYRFNFNRATEIYHLFNEAS